MKHNKLVTILSSILLLVILLIPTTVFAEEEKEEGGCKNTGPQGSAQSFLPDQPPEMKTKETPLYECYSIASYKIDFVSSGSSGVGSANNNPINNPIEMVNLFLNILFSIGIICAKLTIYFLQWSYTLDIFQGLNVKIGDWALNVRDNLFVGKVLASGLIVLCVVLVFSYGRNQEVYEQCRKFVILIVVASMLLSFMTPILDTINSTERFVSDLLFSVYAKTDPNGKKTSNKESLEDTRDRVLVDVGNQFFKNFIYTPWQMAEFGRAPVNPDNKEDKEIIKDTHTILSLNPLLPHEYLEREQKVGEWTGNGLWMQMINNIVPPAAVIAIEGVKQTIGINKPKYPSMTIVNTPQRALVVIGSFIVGTIYGLFLFMLSAASIVCQTLLIILAAVSPILLLTIFIPNWGEVVLLRWGQMFVIAGMYKVIVSLLTIIVLFVSGIINAAGNEGNWGVGWIYFAHLCFVVAVIVFHKLLWQILALPGEAVAGKIEGFVKEAGQKTADTVIGGAKKVANMTTRAAVAAAGASTGNVTALAAASNDGDQSSQSSTPTKQLKMESLENQKEDYVPEDYNAESTVNKPNVAKSLKNPYKKETNESIVFDDMKEKGLNPYSIDDRDIYIKDLQKNKAITKDKKLALSTIGNHAQSFDRQQKQKIQAQKTVKVLQELELIEIEQEQKVKKKKRKKSFPNQILSRFRGGDDQ